MERITAGSVRIRTTSDGQGVAVGICAGTGTSPMLALADLQKRGLAAVEELIAADRAAEARPAEARSAEARSADGLDVDGDGGIGAPVEISYEVVGVLLSSGLIEGGFPGWCAYGTLRAIG